MLQITNLDSFYGESHVLHGISLNVQAGEVVTLIGRNGAGKTSTLKSIIGDIPRRTGSILFNNTEIIRANSEQICKMGVGLVPDDRGIFSTLSVYENLTIGHSLGNQAWSLEKVYTLFPALKDRHAQKASSLSGGEQQMLAIARPLYMGATFLLLDEPTEGLAPVIIDSIGNIIQQLKASGLTILLVEQNLPFATEVADRHYLLEDGRIVREMANTEVAAEEKSLLAHLGV